MTERRRPGISPHAAEVVYSYGRIAALVAEAELGVQGLLYHETPDIALAREALLGAARHLIATIEAHKP